ncbi:UNVERIFIED_CONTAM: hypothetical protein K2H54_015503 [Gekko kuhli]
MTLNLSGDYFLQYTVHNTKSLNKAEASRYSPESDRETAFRFFKKKKRKERKDWNLTKIDVTGYQLLYNDKYFKNILSYMEFLGLTGNPQEAQPPMDFQNRPI